MVYFYFTFGHVFACLLYFRLLLCKLCLLLLSLKVLLFSNPAVTSLGASRSRVKDLPEGNRNAAKKTKPMQLLSSVIDVAEGSAAKVFVGLAFISLSASI